MQFCFRGQLWNERQKVASRAVGTTFRDPEAPLLCFLQRRLEAGPNPPSRRVSHSSSVVGRKCVDVANVPVHVIPPQRSTPVPLRVLAIRPLR